MERRLTTQERADLQNRHKKERDGRIRDRIKAVLAYDDGYTYSEIARILLLDDETIRRHINAYFSKHKLSPENGGSHSYLTVHESAALKAHLRCVTFLYVKDICAYVRKRFNKVYSVSGMTKWLKSNKFRYKKPHGVPAKADMERQEEFIAHYHSLNASLGENDVIYFVDSSHPQHQTKLSYGWIEQGVRKPEKMTACQKRVNLIGAINLDNHDVVHRQVKWVNGDSIEAFLQQLIDANPHAENIHIIWDNAGYHKSEQILSFIKGTKITPHYLPPYSPNLNPIERLWKIMHENVTYNRYYPKFSDFTEAIIGFFDNIGLYLDTIKNRINDNFQRLKFV